MTALEIARCLNVPVAVAALWQDGFWAACRSDTNAEYYIVVGAAFDFVTLTKGNARAIGQRMGRFATRSDERCRR